MGTSRKGLTRYLLLGCAAISVLSLDVQAEGNGVVVLTREVQPHTVGRPSFQKDPDPITVNTNPSQRITSALRNTELSDGDFANVASGASIRSNINQNGASIPGSLNVITNPNGMPGMGAGHGGGGSGTISGTINRAMGSGLAPLGRLPGGQ